MIIMIMIIIIIIIIMIVIIIIITITWCINIIINVIISISSCARLLWLRQVHSLATSTLWLESLLHSSSAACYCAASVSIAAKL